MDKIKLTEEQIDYITTHIEEEHAFIVGLRTAIENAVEAYNGSKNLHTLQVGGEVITIETKDKNGREDTIDFFSEGNKFPEDVLKVFGVERN